jgi:metal-responsive CopG/Arc/MetJ family transcriptional regulator
MKTAISLPNTLCEKAEETTLYMGISRSKLFAIALEEFITRNNRNMIILLSQIGVVDKESFINTAAQLCRRSLRGCCPCRPWLNFLLS